MLVSSLLIVGNIPKPVERRISPDPSPFGDISLFSAVGRYKLNLGAKISILILFLISIQLFLTVVCLSSIEDLMFISRKNIVMTINDYLTLSLFRWYIIVNYAITESEFVANDYKKMASTHLNVNDLKNT